MYWLQRTDLEQREQRELGPFAALSTASGGRRTAEPLDPLRTDFQRDRARVIHSAAFRRLQHKTQVLSAVEGDHYRSRMTHSLEVAQMARGAARVLRLNEDLAEVVALAHDLGHPPFGHAGEETLLARMAEHGGFRHNAQGARIVDVLEDRFGDGTGLNLVAVVRRALLKGAVPAGFPLSPDLAVPAAPPLEAELVDRCDRIAYLCHDVDDGLRAGAFSVQQASELELWQRAAAAAESSAPPRVISEMIAVLNADLIRTCAEALHAGSNRAASGEAARPAIRLGPDAAELAAELHAFVRERFYRAPFVLEKMAHGRAKIVQVFEHLLAHPSELPAAARARIATDGPHRVVCDYIAGMTDRFLLRLSC